MASLSIPNSFTGGNTILSAQVNANFTAIVNWSTTIDQTNFQTFTGLVSWSVSTSVLCINAATSGDQGVATFTSSGVLASSKSILKVNSTAAQTTGDAALYVILSNASSTIPTFKVDNAGTASGIDLAQSGTGNGILITHTGTAAAGKGALKVVSTTAPCYLSSMTTTQRDAISSPAESAELYNSTLKRKQIYDGSAFRSLRFEDIGSSGQLENLTLTASVAANALTIAVKDSSGSNASATSPIYVGVRNATSATGTYTQRSITGALSVVVSSGSTLGHTSAAAEKIYIYVIDNAGTLELAVSSKLFDEGSIVSTTAEGGAGASDSPTVMYSTTARSNVACRLIGRLTSTQATAGTWATSISEIALPPFKTFKAPTIQKFTSGTSQTYTLKAGISYIKVKMVGGGGGGSGSGTGAATSGSDGVDTTFTDGSLTLTAGKGKGGVPGSNGGGKGGTGGTATISSGTGLIANGNAGAGPVWCNGANAEFLAGGSGGGGGLFGGGGSGGGPNGGPSAEAGAANTGGGGGGQAMPNNTSAQGGAGGGGGGGLEMIITSPSASYTYTVGTGGAAGGSGAAGGDGVIYIEEYYA